MKLNLWLPFIGWFEVEIARETDVEAAERAKTEEMAKLIRDCANFGRKVKK